MMPADPRLRPWRTACTLLLLLAAACTDRNPLAPADNPLPSQSLTVLDCSMDVRDGSLRCERRTSRATSGARLDLNYGGQDSYVKLTSRGTRYDAAGQYAETYVSVQNLLSQAIGTPDGITVSGVKVVFSQEPVVTSGSGIVTVRADSVGDFTGTAQPYFEYPQILQPYEISDEKRWVFDVPSTVDTFRFSVFISAAVADMSMPMLDRIWDGSKSTDWFDPENWKDGAVPDSMSVVGIPPDSLFNGQMPVLTANARVLHLRVGGGSTLSLAGFTLEAGANVDAVGTIGGGTVIMTGANALLRGNVDAMRITGGTSLQGSTVASGAVSVSDGALTVTDQALSIRIP